MNRALLATTAFCALSFAPHAALACGGFFCSSAPIDQAGETVVYGLEDDGTITMAVQIRYSGDDDDFAWILPVPAPPEISLGSDALFDVMRRVTEPTFVTSDVTEGTCRSHPRCVSEMSCREVSSGCGFGSPGSPVDPWEGDFVDASTGGGGGWDAAAVDAGEPSGVMVFSEGPIGPYDSVVLGATTAREVVDWLAENEYDVPESSVPLLETYAAAGQIFVALRLRSNVATRVIRPIVLRMAAPEACLPIRLTAIATVPNMPITTFFLGPQQMVPANYSTAIVDTDDIAFWEGRRTWAGAVSDEVRRMGGQAFARDYAGPTPAVTLELPDVEDLATETDAAEFIQELASRGYQGEARLLELFEGYIVPPEGEVSRVYFNCLASESVRRCGEPESFDPAGLSERIQSEITAPRAEAHALVHRHRYLTRLYTTMNAEDMTVDPIFIPDDGVEDQDNVYRARRVTACSAAHFQEDAPQHWDLGGTTLPIRDGVTSSDRAFCRGRGGIPDYEATDCPEPDTASGGCLCMAGGTAPLQGGLLFAIALMLGGRRLRRRSTP